MAIGRFINADVFASTGQGIVGYNMFSYCLNNPIIGIDKTGTIRQIAQDNLLVQGTLPSLLDPLRNAEDITQKLNHAMITNAEEIYAYFTIFGCPAAISYFIKMVQPGGDWDFKSQEEWALDPNKLYLYNDKILIYDDIGNIHYGFVGRVLFSEDVLLIAGGLVQIYTNTSSFSYWNTNWDDPRDQEAIKFGCKLWREGLS